MLTSSTFGIKDVGPRTKEGLGQVGEDRVMAGGGWVNWSCCQYLREGRAQPSGLRGHWYYVRFSTGKKERLARILFLGENGWWISFLGWQMNGRRERSFDRLCTLIAPLIGLGGAAWVPLFPVHLGILLCTAFTTPRSFPYPLACGL
jgi:hypothetical protein